MALSHCVHCLTVHYSPLLLTLPPSVANVYDNDSETIRPENYRDDTEGRSAALLSVSRFTVLVAQLAECESPLYFPALHSPISHCSFLNNLHHGRARVAHCVTGR